MNAAEHVAYWQTPAESDLEMARRFLQRRENLHYCLFSGHLSLEKLLKGLIVARTHEMPPKIHDLLRLADKATLPLEKDIEERLKIFNSFNIWKRVILIISFLFISYAQQNLHMNILCGLKRYTSG